MKWSIFGKTDLKKEKIHIATNIKNEKGGISYPVDIKKMILKLYAMDLKIHMKLTNFPEK